MPTAITWGLEASPFSLKLESLLRFHAVPFRRLPAEGAWLENLRTAFRLERAKRRGASRAIRRWTARVLCGLALAADVHEVCRPDWLLM